jgi:hypothetical protein
VVSVVLSAGILIGLAIPAFGLHTAAFSTDALPRSLPIIQTYDRIQAAFPVRAFPPSSRCRPTTSRRRRLSRSSRGSSAGRSRPGSSSARSA